MKKIGLFTYSCLTAVALQAQEPADALRFSWTVPGGTARSQAVGGAMGSLGGDLSATFVNPAGLAFYKTGDFVFSPRFNFGNSKATYFNRSEKTNDSKFLWGTSGLVTGVGSGHRGRNIAFSLAYNRGADFNSSLLYRGANNQSSFAQQYVEELNSSGIRNMKASYLFPFGASQALNTYWIDPAYDNSGNVTGFKTIFPAGTTLLQEQKITTTGGIDEYAFGLGGSLNERLMLGGSFSVSALKHSKESTFTEADPTQNTANHFNFAEVQDNTTTKGIGVGAKLGLIFKPADFIRVGLAFHTPTVYSLKYTYNINVTTDVEDNAGTRHQDARFINDFAYDSLGYDIAPGEFSYTMNTPFKALASVSYVLREVADVTKQRGFLTADVEYVNYRSASFQPEDASAADQDTKDYLTSLNTAIDRAYKPTFNVRVGGELKFTTVMVRAGAAYYGNPYTNINGERGRRLNLSGGLGYRNKGLFIDLTYVHAITKDVHFPYRLESMAYQGAVVKSGVGNVLATIGVKF